MGPLLGGDVETPPSLELPPPCPLCNGTRLVRNTKVERAVWAVCPCSDKPVPTDRLFVEEPKSPPPPPGYALLGFAVFFFGVGRGLWWLFTGD